MLAEKITPQHQERQAVVYVRQSTLRQVREHLAGQANQYALAERAIALGWSPARVRTIDDDLGHSGRDGTRPGFQALVAAVSLGQVGLILAVEASRLARNNADWHRLLDLAALVGTLIADTDGIFDPRLYHDRLLLGLQGMLSEAEWHVQRQRLAAGRERQVRQGTYRQHLPTGLVRLEDGRVVTDPDPQVRHAIELVFAQFAALGSGQKVLRSLRDQHVLLPRRQTGGPRAGAVLWKLPTEAAVYEILTNPAYAGAFVFGRTSRPPERRPGADGRVARRTMAEWPAVHRDTYPAYLSWDQFLANQQRLTDNASNFQQQCRGAPRAGPALLAGLVVCGHCGRQLQTTYKRTPRYMCTAARASAGRFCLRLEAGAIEAAVVAAFFDAVRPAELDLLDVVLATQQVDHERLQRQHQEQVLRAAYAVRLAEKQYFAVDPDNRLVAAELERRWEEALQTLAALREAADQAAQATPIPSLDLTLRQQLRDIGPRMPELWSSGQLTATHKKELVRSLVRRVIVARPRPDTVQLKIVWVSGAYSEQLVHPGIQRTADLAEYPQLLARLTELAAAGHDDEAIAQCLAAEGFRGARVARLSAASVCRLRGLHGIVSVRTQMRTQTQIAGAWTAAGLAQQLGVHCKWIDLRIAKGELVAHRHPLTGLYLIPDQPDVIARLRASIAHR
jgi:DNA invertase Pin-like site-specific DNA recombinase